jgi:polyisoprenoid-binding protein YceI
MADRTTSLIPPGTWTVDATHSTVGFAVKHMGIANARGRFTEFEGTLQVGDDLASSSAEGTVKVASITTEEAQRDEHLRSPDFFNVEEFPEIRFESTHVEAIDDESTSVVGNLTMHGVTKEVKLSRGSGHRRRPLGQRTDRGRGHRSPQAQRFRHEVQSSAWQRQCARWRQGEHVARHLRH